MPDPVPVLAIPAKSFDRALITYLNEAEIDALLRACNQSTWTGRRDHAMLLFAIQTGLRIFELTGLTRADVHLGGGAHVACHGKGRQDRITPLTSGSITGLRQWLNELHSEPTEPLFPTRSGSGLSRDAIEHRIAHYASTAAIACPTLHGRTITAHVLRHSCAMRLRGGHQRDRALARPRECRHHPDLATRRSGTQRESAGQN